MYKWKFFKSARCVQVKLENGEDLAALKELDQKLWTVLACPTAGLEIPEESLVCMDTNGDKKIHVSDVITTAQWLCKMLHDPEVLFAGEASLPLAAIANTTLLEIATPLATDGIVSLTTVKAAIAGVTIEAQAVPEAPYASGASWYSIIR